MEICLAIHPYGREERFPDIVEIWSLVVNFMRDQPGKPTRWAIRKNGVDPLLHHLTQPLFRRQAFTLQTFHPLIRNRFQTTWACAHWDRSEPAFSWQIV